jgi:hypothetical protein
MNRIKKRIALAGAIVTLALCAATLNTRAANAEELDFKKGPLSDLVHYVGTYHEQEVLADSRIQSALKAALPPPLVAAVAENMQTCNPINFINQEMVLDCGMQHNATDEHVIIAIRVNNGAVAGALMHQGRVVLFGGDKRFDPKLDSYPELSGPANAWAAAHHVHVQRL